MPKRFLKHVCDDDVLESLKPEIQELEYIPATNRTCEGRWLLRPGLDAVVDSCDRV